MQPLKGIRILDLSKVLAGPLCAQYLGDMGADVIKVEPPVIGDDTRAWLPQKGGQSATFLAVNHNKRSLALDLKTAAGQAVHQLALGPRGEVHVPVPRAAVSMRAGAGERAAPQRIQEHSTLPSLKPLLTRQVDTSTHAKSWSPPARDFAQRAVARLRPAARERGARAGGGATRWARATARGRARRRTRCRRARARRGGGAARVQQRGARRPWRPSRARAPRDR